MADIKQTKTDATVVDQLLKQVAGLKFPELPLPLNVTPSTLLLFVKETLAEENQQGKPQLDKLLKILLHENNSAKLLGLNKISNQKIAKATERLNSLADKHEQLKDPEIVAELIKITYDLISELPKSDKQII